MPDKTSVSLTLRIARDGEVQEYNATGTLYRLATGSGWVINCELPELAEAGDRVVATDSPQPAAASHLTLIIRPDEIRMNRKGAVAQEQVFRTGHWLPGIVGTAYGRLPVEARTHRLREDLTAGGGAVEWEYEMRMADQELGRCAITIHIREEQTE